MSRLGHKKLQQKILGSRKSTTFQNFWDPKHLYRHMSAGIYKRNYTTGNESSAPYLDSSTFNLITLEKQRQHITGSVCLWNESSLDFRTAAVSSFRWIKGSPVTFNKIEHRQLVLPKSGEVLEWAHVYSAMMPTLSEQKSWGLSICSN